MNVVKVDLSAKVTGAGIQRAITALRDRRALHAEMAREAVALTQDYLLSRTNHATAERLGAKPTGFYSRISKTVRGDATADAARIRMPRTTGLGRAFHSVVIRPGPGKMFLTIPACARTYGKTAGDFAGQLAFVQKIDKRTPMLVFKDTGEVAFWLRRLVKQEQNRALLPSDRAYADHVSGVAEIYLSDLLES